MPGYAGISAGVRGDTTGVSGRKISDDGLVTSW